MRRLVEILTVLLIPMAAGAAPARHLALGDLNKVGNVRFKTSCAAKTQKEFNRGIALLHSFFYAEARKSFEKVASDDPQCAMAHWGVAMSLYHPIWAPPDTDTLKLGMSSVDKALAIGTKDEREKAYIDALAGFYKNSIGQAKAPASGTPKVTPATAKAAAGATPPKAAAPASPEACHGPPTTPVVDHPQRAKAFMTAMEALKDKYPDDVEAKIFYTLTLLSTASPTDKTFANQRKAGEILEGLFKDKRYKNHPGVAHYLIHAYDNPTLVAGALPAAKAYAKMAPWVPHVLHMPSHSFTRLGMWAESVASNLDSEAAALAYAEKNHPQEASFEELHALDYLAYSALQLGDDKQIDRIAARLAKIDKTHPADDLAVAHAFSAIPARNAVERKDWAAAAALTTAQGKFWAKFPFGEAHVAYANALGRANTGDLAGADKAVARLAQLRDALKNQPRFKIWMLQTEIKRLAAAGWIAHKKGDEATAEKLLRQAVEQDESTGLHPVCPGPVDPAREMLGELLLETKKPAEALVEFEASLKHYPNRLNGLLGAARAASEAGKSDEAKRYYAQVVTQTKKSSSSRADLAEALKAAKAQKGGKKAKPAK